MKYYEFYKTPIFFKIIYFVAIVILMIPIAFLDGLLFFIVSIIILPDSWVKYPIIIVWGVFNIAIFIAWCRMLTGVFLFDDYLEIKMVFCKRKIFYKDIIKCEYIGKFSNDRTAILGGLSNNYYGGDMKECIKITSSNNCFFFGIENSLDFINEINSRIYK